MNTNNIIVKCSQYGLENFVCGQLIGRKGANLWALQEEFGDDRLSIQCELMDDVENVTFITYTTTNAFCYKQVHDRILDRLSDIIYKSRYYYPDAVVELTSWYDNQRTHKIYQDGQIAETASSKTHNNNNAHFTDADFPAL